MALHLSEFESRWLEPRLRVLKWIAGGVLVLLLVRFWYLQILHGGEWKAIAHHNQIRRIPLLAPRGKVFDRHGRVLLDNRESYNVTLIPADVDEKTISILASCVKSSAEVIRETMKKNQQWSPFFPVAIKEDISIEELALVEERLRGLAGVDIEVKPQRNYPEGPVAVHVLGYLSEITAEELADPGYSDYRMGDVIGRDALERLMEEHLRGRDGFKYKLVDARGREVQPFSGQEKMLSLKGKRPVAGNNIVLTLDLELQKEAEKLFRDRAGAAVMMAVDTGEILAMTSSPSYDPEVFIGRMYQEEWKKLESDPGHPLLNRAIQGQYPPGSVFKLVVAAAGLEQGIITEESRFNCRGYFKFGRKKFRCWRMWGHGNIALEQAIVQSCDVYFYNLGKELGIDRIAETAHKFGLGLPTGIRLLSEKPGLIPTTSWKKKNLKSPWIPGETIPCAIGQGYVLVTPIQAVLIPCIIANGGRLFRPQVVKRIEDLEGKVIEEFLPEEYANNIISEDVRELLARAMTGVVNDKRGTAYWTARSGKLTIAGKTGTAQVVRLETKEDKNKEEIPRELRDHAWFVAFAPAEEPEVAVAVLVEHGGQGSTGAAPLAKSLLERYAELRSQYARVMEYDD
jgi:penicillin-binding protein 2